MDVVRAIAVLENHTMVPRDERQRMELFAALAVLRIMALGGDHAASE
jgi:hypothetical protein